MVIVELPLVIVTFLPTCSTAAMTFEAPTRPSLPPKPLVPLVRTQRILPLRTASASHWTLTSLSRPEKRRRQTG